MTGHPSITARETEVFLPSFITQGRKVVVRGLDAEDRYVYDESRQTLFIVASDNKPGRKHKVEVSLNPPLNPTFFVNDFWGDFGGRVVSFSVVVFGIIAYWILMVLTRGSYNFLLV